MWPNLSDETIRWRAHCKAFAEEVIAPNFARYDRENSFPLEVHRHAKDWSILNIDQPTNLGGQGLSGVSAVVGIETLASVCAPCAFTLGFNRGALHPVEAAGTPEQKERFIGQLVQRQEYAALCLTEANAPGSNLLGLQTQAVQTDQGWLINGAKVMVGNGGVASQFLVLAQTIVQGQPRGVNFFIVPKGPGVIVGPNTDKLGFRAVETPEVQFKNAEVDDFHRLGDIGTGTDPMLKTLHFIRVGGAATILGIVVGALKDALAWIEERKVYGGSLSQKSHVQLVLGQIFSKLELTRRMILEAALLRDDGQPYGHQASIAKLHAAELAIEATHQVVQLFGWRGIDAEYPIQKRYRDARQTPIFEGTSETQKLNLFRHLADIYKRDEPL